MQVNPISSYIEVCFSGDSNLYLRYDSGIRAIGIADYGIHWFVMEDGNWIRLSQGAMEGKYQECLKQS